MEGYNFAVLARAKKQRNIAWIDVSLSRPVTRAHKIANLIGVPLPLIGVVVAIVLLWNRAIGPLELALLIGFYVFTASA